MDKPGTRVELYYMATTQGHGDLDEKTGSLKTRLVQPVSWLNHCQLRIFLAEDGHKYRISGIHGTAVLQADDNKDEKGMSESSNEK